MYYTPGPFLGLRWFLTMYFVNMLSVLYRPALFYLWVGVSYHDSYFGLYCSVLVLTGVYTVLFSGDPVVWVGHSGVPFS